MDSPKFLGPYQIGEILGRGGMGAVYTAVHAKSGQRVAVKLISPHVSDERKFRDRFNAEIETLKLLRHRNIVQLIGYGEEKGQLFYSMELVEGESLQKRIRREKRLDWLGAIDIAIQVCSALKHAHDIGVIHRDLKPANLVLTEHDQVKLVDFGIAKIFGYGEQTAVGSVLGTADYMAPEQVRNEGITPRTDLYALGSVMYAMLSGRPPFRGKNVTEVIEALTRDQPIPLDVIIPDLPEAVTELVHDLLQKDPADRPPTARAVMNRLKAMRAGLQRELTVDEQNAKTQVKFSGESSQAVSGPNQTPAKPSARTVHQGASPKDETVADPAVGGTQKRDTDAAEIDTLDRSESSTHFQTVDSGTAESQVFISTESDTDTGFVRGLSIGLLIAALMVGVILVARSLQGPSADDVYGKIFSIRNASQLSDARSEIDRFLKLFPQDHRFQEVQDMRTSLELEAVVRRLRLKAKLELSPLAAHEQAFVDAMNLRETDPVLAQEKLRQWLAVFVDSNTHAADIRVRMGELARFELLNLKRQGPIKSVDKRVKDLLGRIKAAEELPIEERRNLLEGLVDLYQDQDWAEPVVQEAQQQLAELNAG
jgi:serine/threonine-protein kinase